MIYPPPQDTTHGAAVVLIVHYPGGRQQEIDMPDAATAERYYIALVNSQEEPKPIGWRTRAADGKQK